MARRYSEPPIEPRDFRSSDEIDRAMTKLRRRIQELSALDMSAAVLRHTGADDTARSNVRETIREVFGDNSPEYREHQYIDIWSGPTFMGMSDAAIIESKRRGCTHVIGILDGLIARLAEKKADLSVGATAAPPGYFDRSNLHPRIADVSCELFLDGYAWDAVFAASKALVNFIKDRSGRHDLDGAQLVRTVFSKNDPILVFNALADRTDLDEQEGMMHLFEGAVLAIRNPGGHSFPEGSEQRAMEYISFLSLLAYRLQESKRNTGQRPPISGG